MSLKLKFFCALRDSNPRPIAWRMTSLPTHLSSTCDSGKNNFLLNYHVEGPFVRVGNTNRDKRVLFYSGLVLPTGTKGLGLLSRMEPPTGTKGGPFVPVGASN